MASLRLFRSRYGGETSWVQSHTFHLRHHAALSSREKLYRFKLIFRAGFNTRFAPSAPRATVGKRVVALFNGRFHHHPETASKASGTRVGEFSAPSPRGGSLLHLAPAMLMGQPPGDGN